MIRLTRIRSEATIHENFHGQKKRAFEKELLLNQRRIRRSQIEKHTFKSNRWKPAKKQLLAETGDKCAYCEASISAVAFGDVDHYRPKSSYWWLAYCYDNYLVACQLCNQKFKKNTFPTQNRKMQSPTIRRNTTDKFIAAKTGTIAPDPLNKSHVDDFIRLHQQERPLLLNPYFDDPTEYFAWRADDVLREVEATASPERDQVAIIVNADTNPEVKSIAAASIEYYGLNRKALKNDRYMIYDRYRLYKQVLTDDRIQPATRIRIVNSMERMKAPGAQFAGMIRYFEALFSSDKISLEEGLSGGEKPRGFKEDESSWSLGTTSNLTRMHVRAMGRLTEDQINDDLVKRTREAKLGQNGDDVSVHALPNSPADIPDNPDLHFVIVGPEYAAVPGDAVPASLKAFFDRTYRNNVIILAPESSRLTGLRYLIGRILGWSAIEGGDEMNLLTGTQQTVLIQRKQDDETGIADSVTLTYSVLIAVDEAGEIKAHQLPRGQSPPFEQVKNFLEGEERMLTTALDPDLLTPDSFFELWGEGETAKPVQGLYGMFASLPRLPRLLGQKVFLETLQRGVTEGRIVLRTMRPDGSQHTQWRESPPDEDLSSRDLEIVPIEYAELHNFNPELLRPGRLPDLWQGENVSITVGAIRKFFAGDDAPKLASDEILFGAIRDAVEAGFLMARHQNRAYLEEAIPDAVLKDDLELFRPSARINGSELSQNTLPEAWEGGTSSVGKVMDAFAANQDMPIPWKLVVDAVNDGLSKNLFEIAKGSPAWPCSADGADKIGLQVSQVPVTVNPKDFIAVMQQPGQSTLGLIKEELESKKGVSIPDDMFRNAVQEAIDQEIITLVDPLTNDLYQIRVNQPSWQRYAESPLTEIEIQDLSGVIGDLIGAAPELDFKFRISITAEGEPPSTEVLEQINEALRKVTDQLKFD